MLALYRDGRQTEALEVYREFRSVLQEELGLDPHRFSASSRRRSCVMTRLAPPVSTTTGAPLARRPVTVLCLVLQVASELRYGAGPGGSRSRERARSFWSAASPGTARRKAGDQRRTSA